MKTPATRLQRVINRHVRRDAVMPTSQVRAQQTRDRLLQSGRDLLQSRDFDELSIADLSSAMGLSVGSFYGRFRDKAAYLQVLQEWITDEWRAKAASAFSQEAGSAEDARRIVRQVVRFVVTTMAQDRGFVRAAVRQAPHLPSGWTPMMRTSAAFTAQIEAVLAPGLLHLPPRSRRTRVRFALQIIFGTLLNAILHDPGPIRLDDPGFARELTAAANAYLGLDP